MSETKPNRYPGESMTPREAIESSEDHYRKYKELHKEATEADKKATDLSHDRASNMVRTTLSYDFYETKRAEEAQAEAHETISRKLADEAFSAYAAKGELNRHLVDYIPDVVSKNRAAFHDAAVAEARLDGVIIDEEQPAPEETKTA